MLTYHENLKRIENYDEYKADFSGREPKPLVKPFQKIAYSQYLTISECRSKYD